MNAATHLLLLLPLVTIWYYCYVIYAALALFRRSPAIDPDFQPPITILKPICGLDNDSYENFASFCRQNYSQYQIIFGVRDAQDPCIEVVRQIMQDFPAVDIQLVISDRLIGTNLKVSNLANAELQAKYPILLLADSDVWVGPDYIQRIIQPLRDPKVGVVTCLYRPLTRGWVANFEALGIATDYLAGVVAANKLEGMKYTLGPTVVIQRQVLQEIGGFAAIADYLADDYQLGNLPSRLGYKVVLSDYIIDHVISTDSITDLLRRQLRWAYCTRVSRPGGYLGLIFTHSVAASLFCFIGAQASGWAWVGIALIWLTRLLMAWIVGVWGLKDTVVQRSLWLIPLRDLVSFLIWGYGFVSNHINWRGQRMCLTREGKMIALTINSTSRKPATSSPGREA